MINLVFTLACHRVLDLGSEMFVQTVNIVPSTDRSAGEVTSVLVFIMIGSASKQTAVFLVLF